ALAHVGDDVSALAVGAGEDLVEGGAQFVLVPAGNDDVGAGLGEGAGHGEAKSLAAAGHQGDAASEAKQVRNGHGKGLQKEVSPACRRGISYPPPACRANYSLTWRANPSLFQVDVVGM